MAQSSLGSRILFVTIKSTVYYVTGISHKDIFGLRYWASRGHGLFIHRWRFEIGTDKPFANG